MVLGLKQDSNYITSKLTHIVAKEGHSCLTLWRATFLLSELKALVASTRRTASVSLLSNDSFMAWSTASTPAGCPAHNCSTLFSLSSDVRQFAAS